MQLPLSHNAFKWVLIVVDNFSRYIEAVPLNTVNGQSVGNMLMTHIICKHGCPSVLICDNASYYVGGDFPKLCKSLGIHMAPVSAYHPEANRITESKVKALKRLLRSLVKQEFYNWDQFLPYAVFAFNTSFNSRTGFTPFYVNHGFEANMPGTLPMTMNALEMKQEIQIAPNSYCADIFQKFLQTFQMVYNNLEMESQKLTNLADVPDFFQLGDEVFLFSPVLHINEPKSFKEFWTGPYRITQIINPVVFKIESLEDPLVTGKVHASRLKKKF